MKKETDKASSPDGKHPEKDSLRTPDSEMLTAKWSQEKMKQVLGDKLFEKEAKKASGS